MRHDDFSLPGEFLEDIICSAYTRGERGVTIWTGRFMRGRRHARELRGVLLDRGLKIDGPDRRGRLHITAPPGFPQPRPPWIPDDWPPPWLPDQ